MSLFVHATYEFPFSPELPSDGAPNVLGEMRGSLRPSQTNG